MRITNPFLVPGFPNEARNPTLKPAVRQRPLSDFMRLGLFLGLIQMATLAVPQNTRAAGMSETFLETIGISTAVGIVLGASTLPFYDIPGKHLINLAYGASIGAAAGVLVASYLLVTGPLGRGEEEFPELGLQGSLRIRSKVRRSRMIEWSSQPGINGTTELFAHHPIESPPTAQVWMPLVSLTW